MVRGQRQFEFFLSGEDPPAHVCYLNGEPVFGRTHHQDLSTITQTLPQELKWKSWDNKLYFYQESPDLNEPDKILKYGDTVPIGARIYTVEKGQKPQEAKRKLYIAKAEANTGFKIEI